MPFPLNNVVLSALADIDLLAAVALTDTSSRLHHFILEQVITTSHICRFLRKYQCVLQHDLHHRMFTNKEIAWVHRAFEAVRHRNGPFLFRNTIDLLGPLISRTPFTLLQKVPRYLLHQIESDYLSVISQSWMHLPELLINHEPRKEKFYQLQAEEPSLYLRDEFLFCRRYIDQFNETHFIGEPIMESLTTNKLVLDGPLFTQLRKTFEEKHLNVLHFKRYLQATITWLSESSSHWIQSRPILTSDSFRGLFELPGWMELWNPAELGWLCALGLSRYGERCVPPLIDKSFANVRTALLWMFLGAHGWYHDSFTIEDLRPKHISDGLRICKGCTHTIRGHEEFFLYNQLNSLSYEDRLWLLEQIVRRAEEFGVCLNLGAYVFNHFVMRDEAEAADMLSNLLEVIIDTRLQYHLEYAISLALKSIEWDRGFLPDITSSRKYLPKLISQDTELYSLLAGELLSYGELPW